MGVSVFSFESGEEEPAVGRDLEQSESQVSLGVTHSPVSEVLHAFHSREQPFTERNFLLYSGNFKGFEKRQVFLFRCCLQMLQRREPTVYVR